MYVERQPFSSKEPMSSERELQSTLVRLSVLCASALHTIVGEHIANTITDAEQDGALLAAKIHGDTVTILRLVQKDTTALSVAMRPKKGKEISDDSPPTACIDSASIEAANRLLQGLAVDHVPKLVFLVNLAQKNRAVYRPAKGDEADQAAHQMGTVLNAKHGELVARASVGSLYAADLKRGIGQVVELVAQLCQSFMDSRTRMALEAASRRRGQEPEATPKPSRAYSLQLTKQLWSTCDALVGTPDHTPPLETRLARNNQEAYAKACKCAEPVLADATSEMKEALASTGKEQEVDDAWDLNVELSPEENELVCRTIALLEHGSALQTAVRGALLRRDVHADFDEANAALASLVELQDNVASLALYGEEQGEESLDEAVNGYARVCAKLADSAGTYRNEAIDKAASAATEAAAHVREIL